MAKRTTSPTPQRRDAVRVVVVDDHPLFLKGLIDAIAHTPGLTVCGEADSVATGLASIETHRPDVAIVDLALGNENGLDLVSAVVTDHPSTRVLVLSGYDEFMHADRALKAGALGFIMKDKAVDEVI